MPTPTIETITRDGADVLTIHGDVDLRAVEALSRAVDDLLGLGPRRLLIDLTGTGFIGSLGVGQLMALCVQVRKDGGSAVIACSDGNVREVLERCRMDAIAPIVASLDAARAALGPD